MPALGDTCTYKCIEAECFVETRKDMRYTYLVELPCRSAYGTEEDCVQKTAFSIPSLKQTGYCLLSKLLAHPGSQPCSPARHRIKVNIQIIKNRSLTTDQRKRYLQIMHLEQENLPAQVEYQLHGVECQGTCKA